MPLIRNFVRRAELARRMLSSSAREYPRARYGVRRRELEVIQQMHSHYIAALVRSVVDITEVRTS
jgi:hypothetical protein